MFAAFESRFLSGSRVEVTIVWALGLGVADCISGFARLGLSFYGSEFVFVRGLKDTSSSSCVFFSSLSCP